MNQLNCECCGRVLDPKKIIWLELNWKTNLYYRDETVPDAESQGGFPFGPDCARKIINNGGKI